MDRQNCRATMEAIHDRNLSGSNIRDHLRDEERIELGTYFLMSVVVAYFS